MRKIDQTGRAARRTRSDPRAGQAIAEFAVALVAMLALLAGLLQIGRLTREHLAVANRARASADRYAMADDYTLALPGPRYIRDWEPGADQAPYSRDDQNRLDDSALFSANVIVHSHPELLNAVAPSNRVSALSGSVLVADAFELVRGSERSDPIPLLPVARHLFYDAESIVVEADAWSVWTKGIY